jgi:hypothetical protein
MAASNQARASAVPISRASAPNGKRTLLLGSTDYLGSSKPAGYHAPETVSFSQGSRTATEPWIGSLQTDTLGQEAGDLMVGTKVFEGGGVGAVPSRGCPVAVASRRLDVANCVVTVKGVRIRRAELFSREAPICHRELQGA